jgi:hypothetical protein
MTNRWSQLIFVAAAVAATALPAAAQDAQDEKIAKAIQDIQNWQYGQKADDLELVAKEVVQAARDPARRRAMEKLIIDGLAAAKTRGAKAFFYRQLVVVGTQAAVPQLARLLDDPESSHMARYALERIPGRAGDEALLKALASADEKLKVGMVFSLGRRGCKEAVGPIAALLAGGSEDLVTASLVALSRIDSDEAVAAVAKARQTVPAKIKPTATAAYLDCAKRMADAGRTAEALAIYRKLYAPGEPTMCRVAALRGMVAARSDQAAALAIAAMADPDPKVREVAIPTLRNVPGQQVTQAIVAELPRRDEKVQVMLLSVLADRGDKAALPAVVRAAETQSRPVRLAALDALAELGSASTVPMLAQWAADADQREEKEAARSSLDRLQADGVNAAIVRAMGSAAAGVRAELVRSLAARGAADRMEAVLKAAEDADAAVQAEAMKALRALAGAEHVPALVRLLVRTADEKVRAEAENAVVTAARKAPDGAAPARSVLNAMKTADPGVKASLIRVLGRIGHKDALDCLYAAARDADADVKDAAIRALADWPGGEPIRVLAGIAADPSATTPHRVIALRGYVNMIQKQANASDEQILADYAKAMAMATRPQEKQLVLSKLASLRHRRALEMARRCADDPALKGAAEAAIQKIEKLLSAPAAVTASHNPQTAGNAIDGKPDTRWDTAAAMQGGEWFRIELNETKLITGIVLDAKGSAGDYPRGYEVYVSTSSLGQGRLVAKGKGTGPVVEIKFDKPVAGKAIKIVQTGRTDGLYWSIHELEAKSQPLPK